MGVMNPSATIVVLCGLIASPLSAAAQTIDFETLSDGTPYTSVTDAFFSDEYASTGVLIVDSDPNPTFSWVTNQLAEDTGLSGYHLLVGAFAGVQTSATLEFPEGITDLSFDWGSASGGMVTVSTYDELDRLLSTEVFEASGSYTLPSGGEGSFGSVSITSETPIAWVLVEPVFNHVLRLDNLTFLQVPPPAPGPEIDIKPGVDPNRIDLFALKRIPVAILGSESFDVDDVDPDTLALGPGSAPIIRRGNASGRYVDVNGDGLTDLVSYFATHATLIALGDVEACLSGETLNGTAFNACDAIVTTPQE